jgi:hypothetical protein
MIKLLAFLCCALGTEPVLIDASYEIGTLYQYYLRLLACQKSFPEHDEFSEMLFELRRVAKDTERQLSRAEIDLEWNNQARIFLQSGLNRRLDGWYWLTVCQMHTSEAAQKIRQLSQPARPLLPKKDF